MVGFLKKHRISVIIVSIVTVVLLLLILIFRFGLFAWVFFRMNYDSNEFYIDDVLYYKSKNDSDLSEILDSKGIEFPSVVYCVKSYDFVEKRFYIGTHSLRVWDTYQTDIVGREIVVEGLQLKASVFVRELLSFDPLLRSVRVWLIPYTAQDGYDSAELYKYDMDFSGDIPFKRKDILFETDFILESEDENGKNIEKVMGWLMLLEENDLSFGYVTIMYNEVDHSVYDRYEMDYYNLELKRKMD
ncbi:MAG: hypothetical protein FWH57_09725 [Oscillospiraceae bacterium]|nr:hypothetical protein [Oscillospiraceae bacterium]